MAAPIYHVAFPTFSAALADASAADYTGVGAGLETLVAGTADGPRDVLEVVFTPIDTTTAGNVIRLFKDDGTNKIPLGDIPVPTMTKVATGYWRTPIRWSPPARLTLNGTSDLLTASEEKGDDINVYIRCGDYQ